MAYIVAKTSEAYSSPAASIGIPVPSDALAGDLLLALCTQDGGATNITAVGWTVAGVQAASQGQRTAALYKFATGGSEVFEVSGTLEEWAVSIIVIRGADPEAPIHAVNTKHSPNSTTAYLDSGQVTTTVDGCILIYVCGFDNTARVFPELPDALTPIAQPTPPTGCVQFSGYKVMRNAGQSPVVRFLSEVASEGGTCIVLAIKDASPESPSLPAEVKLPYQIVTRLGGWQSSTATQRAAVRHETTTLSSFSTLGPATIAGLEVSTAAPTGYSAADTLNGGWTANTTAAFNTTGAGNGWAGIISDIPSVNMEGKIFSAEMALTVVSNVVLGSLGYLLYFQDISGNWAAYKISSGFGLTSQVAYRAYISVGVTPPDDSGGTIDWGGITKIGYAYHRKGASVVTFYVRGSLLLASDCYGVGGCAAAPLNILSFANQANYDYPKLALTQGSQQCLVYFGFQIGDGVTPTYFKAFGSILELPQKIGTDVIRRAWLVSDDAIAVTINASPFDVVDFSSSVAISGTRQVFRVAASSSPSATYKFNGAVIVGFKVDLMSSGVLIAGANITRCYTTALASQLMECSISDCLDSVAVSTASPANIINCSFIQGPLGGHAIEITQPGTFAFVGNTFEGYGLDGTTDAAIYNNSGGHVVLNVSGGGDTPTVRNGAGATTEVVSGVTLTFVGVKAGSEIHIFDSNATLLASVESAVANQTITLQATGIQVRVFIASLGYENLDIPYLVPASDSTVPVFQRIDRNYRNPT